jgi:hypothetical protein
MKNASIDLTKIKQAILGFFRRFHTILFFLLVSCGLFVAIIVLLGIINTSSRVGPADTNGVGASFDQATIDRINDLDTASDSKPGSRESPFVE